MKKEKWIKYHWDVIGLVVLVSIAASGAEYLYNLPDVIPLIVTMLVGCTLGVFGYHLVSFEERRVNEDE